jgi:hypothetical protein
VANGSLHIKLTLSPLETEGATVIAKLCPAFGFTGVTKPEGPTNSRAALYIS